jgi:hypothetical protein
VEEISRHSGCGIVIVIARFMMRIGSKKSRMGTLEKISVWSENPG